MGGIGKTELARQFGWQQWREKTYPGGICWLNVAESDGGFRLFVTWYGSIGGHKLTKSLSGNRLN
jgi:hypothetical protein